MAIPELSAELRLVAWAALVELKKTCGTQQRLADVLGVSPFTISNALRKKWASRDLLDAILRHLGGLSEAQLAERYGAALTTSEASVPKTAIATEPSPLTIAVSRMTWDARLSADQRENVVRSVAKLVAGWGTADPSVQVWTDLLRSHELIALFGDASDLARGRQAAQDEASRRS
ncbi:hypothetical protein LVJ94_17195 [Pendulispora rubella]|uniref:HTH cro/C1-type domain-containing protein n=1 Tax=Pendulispora rubella TaxID=2741070 RepID=A0ABZ2LDE7_9BACT